MEVATKEAHSALTRAASNMAHFYNAHCREAPLYTFGDKVWLNRQNITITHPMKKLDHNLAHMQWTRTSHKMLISSSYHHPLANVRVFPLWHPHHLSESTSSMWVHIIWAESSIWGFTYIVLPILPSSLISSDWSHQLILTRWHYEFISDQESSSGLLYSCNWCSSVPQLYLWG